MLFSLHPSCSRFCLEVHYNSHLIRKTFFCLLIRFSLCFPAVWVWYALDCRFSSILLSICFLSFLIGGLMPVINFGNAWLLFKYFFCFIRSPSGTSSTCVRHLSTLFHSSWMFWVFFVLFAFQFGKFLLTSHQAHWLSFSAVSSLLRWPSKALFTCQVF